MDITITEVDPLAGDGMLERCIDVDVAVERAEFGDRHTARSADEVRARLRLAKDARVTVLAACSGDDVVGTSGVELPLLDNLHLVTFGINVLPGARRAGVGTALLARVTELARAGGRTTLVADSEVAIGNPPTADAFAARHGFAAELVEIRSDLDVPASGVDALLAPLEADAAAHADGYDVLTWWDDVPERWIDQRAAASARMSTDAPSGGLDLQEESWDADRMRELLRVLREQGRRWVETVAVHRASGRIAAYTDIGIARHTPQMAYQWDTLVLKEHRGRRLGQLVKAVNLRALLAELPDVGRVVTWNAEVNEPMLRVNRAMGFVPVGIATEWQKVLT